jgi:hypothetical protein
LVLPEEQTDSHKDPVIRSRWPLLSVNNLFFVVSLVWNDQQRGTAANHDVTSYQPVAIRNPFECKPSSWAIATFMWNNKQIP